jgi:hypothetical protein
VDSDKWLFIFENDSEELKSRLWFANDSLSKHPVDSYHPVRTDMWIPKFSCVGMTLLFWLSSLVNVSRNNRETDTIPNHVVGATFCADSTFQ